MKVLHRTNITFICYMRIISKVSLISVVKGYFLYDATYNAGFIVIQYELIVIITHMALIPCYEKDEMSLFVIIVALAQQFNFYFISDDNVNEYAIPCHCDQHNVIDFHSFSLIHNHHSLPAHVVVIRDLAQHDDVFTIFNNNSISSINPVIVHLLLLLLPSSFPSPLFFTSFDYEFDLLSFICAVLCSLINKLLMHCNEIFINITCSIVNMFTMHFILLNV